MSEIQKLFYPYCKENNCGGVLEIKINDNFSVDYKCSKNPLHKKENIYFKTFERFYLKEKEVDKCSQTNKIKIKNKSQKSNKPDIHTKKNNNNLEEISKLNIIDYIPSKHKINKILNKLKTYEELINIINDWQKKLMNKIEHLKENILNEKSLLNKMILNFDKNFLDYTYFANIKYLYKYKNKIYSELINKITFEKRTKSIMKYLCVDLETENNKSDDTQTYIDLNESDKCKNPLIIKKINDDCFLNYSKKKEISLMTYDIKKNSLIKLDKLSFEKYKQIENIYISNDKNDKDIYYIYICLTEKKVIKFYKVNAQVWKLEKMKDKIKEKTKGYYKNCIYIGKSQFATVDNEEKEKILKKNENIFLNIKEILFSNEIHHLLFVNNEYLVVSSFYKNIYFINNNSLDIEKKLNVKYYDNVMNLNDKYIIYTCNESVGLIYIKTKEVVQFIEGYFREIFFDHESFYVYDKETSDELKSRTFHGSYVYGYDYEIKITKYEFIKDTFIQNAQYIYTDHFESDFHHGNAYDDFEDKEINMIIIKNRMILWTDKLYISSDLSS